MRDILGQTCTTRLEHQDWARATEKSLPRQTSYSGKKKKKKEDPLGLGCHINTYKIKVFE